MSDAGEDDQLAFGPDDQDAADIEHDPHSADESLDPYVDDMNMDESDEEIDERGDGGRAGRADGDGAREEDDEDADAHEEAEEDQPMPWELDGEQPIPAPANRFLERLQREILNDPEGGVRARHLRQARVPEFVRMLWPMQPANGRERRTNDDLVRLLKRNASISSQSVIKAFKVCSRDIFVPDAQRNDAFNDHPLPLDQDFNISAPHMHACMIQGLKVEPGDDILDIGSGCGVTTAMLAYLTGKQGSVLGLELRPACLELATNAMATMVQKPEFCAHACPVQFEHGNAFMLPHHEGKFDKVHVGGLCELAKIPALLKLLKPNKGSIVVPCDQELLCITRDGSKLTREVLAHVRFGELEMPSDAEIILSHLKHHRSVAFTPEEVESPFDSEMAELVGPRLLPARPTDIPTGGGRTSGQFDDEELEVQSACTCGSFGLSSRCSPAQSTPLVSRMFHSPPAPAPAGTSPNPSPPSGFTPPTTHKSPAHPSPSLQRHSAPVAPPPPPPPAAHLTRADLDASLGETDCVVRGAAFALPAHAAVLQARCPLIRKQCDSGMRDARAREVTLPPHFTEAPVAACLAYLYTNRVELDAETALLALEVAVYLCIPHLVSLCSAYIIRHLRLLPVPEAVENAAQLHAFASEHGLEALCKFCASFLAVHLKEARQAPSYRALGNKELDEVLEAVAGERELVVSRLEELSCGIEELGSEFGVKARA